MILSGSRMVLAVFAHPDDAELTCFGTLAKLNFQGAKVNLLDLTNGEGSTTAKAGKRAAEAKAAAHVIEAERVTADWPDGKLSYDNEMVSFIEKHIRQLSPDVVITHHPQGFGQGHQDHYAVSCATLNAARRSPSVNWILYAEPQTQNSDFIPNFFVDVTDTIELKKLSLSAYASESSKSFMQNNLIDSRARWWAMQASLDEFNKGKLYEAFSVIKGVMNQPFIDETPPNYKWSRQALVEPEKNSETIGRMTVYSDPTGQIKRISNVQIFQGYFPGAESTNQAVYHYQNHSANRPANGFAGITGNFVCLPLSGLSWLEPVQ